MSVKRLLYFMLMFMIVYSFTMKDVYYDIDSLDVDGNINELNIDFYAPNISSLGAHVDDLESSDINNLVLNPSDEGEEDPHFEVPPVLTHELDDKYLSISDCELLIKKYGSNYDDLPDECKPLLDDHFCDYFECEDDDSQEEIDEGSNIHFDKSRVNLAKTRFLIKKNGIYKSISIDSEEALNSLVNGGYEIYIDNKLKISLLDVSSISGFNYTYNNYNLTGNNIGICLLDSGVNDVGYVLDGYDFVNNGSHPIDPLGHGTVLASVIHNLSPNSTIVDVKVIGDDGSGYSSDVINGINWCIEHKNEYNISVILMAFGGGKFDGYCGNDVLNDPIKNAYDSGLLVVTASGNDGYDGYVETPSCVPYAFAVGSSTKNDSLSDFTNINDVLDVVAPGEHVEIDGLSYSGTSISAAVVSAAATLLYEHNNSFEPLDLIALFRGTGVRFEDKGYNLSRLDVKNALESPAYDYPNLEINDDSSYVGSYQPNLLIVSCTDITSPGYYELTADLNGVYGSNNYCIRIRSSDVELDCKGHEIFDDSGNSGTRAIYIYGGRNNVSVHDCDLKNYSYGIYAYANADAENYYIYRNDISSERSGSLYGIRIFTSSSSKIKRLRITENNVTLASSNNYGYGIYSYGKQYDVLINKNYISNLDNYYGSSAIYLRPLDNNDFIVEENTILKVVSSKSISQGIYVYNNPNVSDFIIRNNVISHIISGNSNDESYGIRMIAYDSLVNTTLSKNEIYDLNSSYNSRGIYVYARNTYLKNVNISANYIYNLSANRQVDGILVRTYNRSNSNIKYLVLHRNRIHSGTSGSGYNADGIYVNAAYILDGINLSNNVIYDINALEQTGSSSGVSRGIYIRNYNGSIYNLRLYDNLVHDLFAFNNSVRGIYLYARRSGSEVGIKMVNNTLENITSSIDRGDISAIYLNINGYFDYCNISNSYVYNLTGRNGKPVTGIYFNTNLDYIGNISVSDSNIDLLTSKKYYSTGIYVSESKPINISISNSMLSRIFAYYSPRAVYIRGANFTDHITLSNLTVLNLTSEKDYSIYGIYLYGNYGIRNSKLDYLNIYDINDSGAFISGIYLRSRYPSTKNLTLTHISGNNIYSYNHSAIHTYVYTNYADKLYLDYANISNIYGNYTSNNYVSGIYVRASYVNNSHVRFANVSNITAWTTRAWGILYVTNNATNISVENSNVSNITVQDGNLVGGIYLGSYYENNMSSINNHIHDFNNSGAVVALKLLANRGLDKIYVINNTINDLLSQESYIRAVDLTVWSSSYGHLNNSKVSDNVVRNLNLSTNSQNVYGYYLVGYINIKNLTILNNSAYNLTSPGRSAYAFYVAAPAGNISRVDFSNNKVDLLKSNYTPYGIYLYSYSSGEFVSDSKIYNNSFTDFRLFRDINIRPIYISGYENISYVNISHNLIKNMVIPNYYSDMISLYSPKKLSNLNFESNKFNNLSSLNTLSAITLFASYNNIPTYGITAINNTIDDIYAKYYFYGLRISDNESQNLNVSFDAKDINSYQIIFLYPSGANKISNVYLGSSSVRDCVARHSGINGIYMSTSSSLYSYNISLVNWNYSNISGVGIFGMYLNLKFIKDIKLKNIIFNKTNASTYNFPIYFANLDSLYMLNFDNLTFINSNSNYLSSIYAYPDAIISDAKFNNFNAENLTTNDFLSLVEINAPTAINLTISNFSANNLTSQNSYVSTVHLVIDNYNDSIIDNINSHFHDADEVYGGCLYLNILTNSSKVNVTNINCSSGKRLVYIKGINETDTFENFTLWNSTDYAMYLHDDTNYDFFTNVFIFNTSKYLGYSGVLDTADMFYNLTLGYNRTVGLINWSEVKIDYVLANSSYLILDPDFVSLNSLDYNVQRLNANANITLRSYGCPYDVYRAENFPQTREEILINGVLINPSYKECLPPFAVFSTVGDFDNAAGYAIYSCFNISAPGEYEVYANLQGNKSDGACITVNASDVVLNCTGKNITGLYPNTKGIYVYNNSNISIFNCTISNYSSGLELYNNTNSSTYNNTLYNNAYSQLLNSVNNLVINGTFIFDSDFGIFSNNSQNNNISYTTVENSNYGVYDYNSTGNIYRDSILQFNEVGLKYNMGSYINLTHNTIYNNSIVGINLTGDDVYVANNSICFNDLDIFNTSSTLTAMMDMCYYWDNWQENQDHLGCEFSCSDVWHIFFGYREGYFKLGDGSTIMKEWLVNGGYVYAYSSSDTPDWLSLLALGRKTDNSIANNDFSEADNLLGISGTMDSIENTFSTDGTHPINTVDIYFMNHTIQYVPIVNTTNDSTRWTGILWDSAMDSNGEFDSTDGESLVFVANITSSSVNCKYGSCTYEIKVPGTFDTYRGDPTAVVYFYTELQ